MGFRWYKGRFLSDAEYSAEISKETEGFLLLLVAGFCAWVGYGYGGSGSAWLFGIAGFLLWAFSKSTFISIVAVIAFTKYFLVPFFSWLVAWLTAVLAPIIAHPMLSIFMLIIVPLIFLRLYYVYLSS